MNNKPWEVLPEPFLERLGQIIPHDQLNAVLQTFCEEKAVTFRTNMLKISTEALKSELEKRALPFQQVSWYPDAFILENPDLKEKLFESDLYMEGKIYMQSLSSMVPALLLDLQTDDLVGDLTAAPGSKTTQMAMLMQNGGKIIANDISRARLYRLKANLEQQGVTNTDLSLMPGQALWKKYSDYFDKVLVDVPCTLEGRFSTLDLETYQDWKPKKAKLLSQLQRILLRSAITTTRPGGLIVYSTCTFEPEENEGVIDWILKKEEGNIVLEDASTELDARLRNHNKEVHLQHGLLGWNKRQFSPDLSKTVRVLPSKTFEGFYVAKIRKLKKEEEERPLVF